MDPINSILSDKAHSWYCRLSLITNLFKGIDVFVSLYFNILFRKISSLPLFTWKVSFKIHFFFPWFNNIEIYRNFRSLFVILNIKLGYSGNFSASWQCYWFDSAWSHKQFSVDLPWIGELFQKHYQFETHRWLLNH